MKKTAALLTLVLALSIILFLSGCNLQENQSPQDPKVSGDTEQGTSDNPGILPGEQAPQFGEEEQKRMALYLGVLEGAFREENGGDGFIAVKLDTLEGLSDEAKAEVLRRLTYLSSQVYRFDEVKEDESKFVMDE